MKCVVCNRVGGNDRKGVITLQSTPSGPVCPTCIYQLVDDVIKMRRPWTRADLKKWGIRRDWALYGDDEE
tara:strand:- start:152 stop:361 length:210 start_codon:yes stop_codon:yes gene_type:complete